MRKTSRRACRYAAEVSVIEEDRRDRAPALTIRPYRAYPGEVRFLHSAAAATLQRTDHAATDHRPGTVLRGGGLLRRPLGVRGPGGDHARPRRPRPLGLAALPGLAGGGAGAPHPDGGGREGAVAGVRRGAGRGRGARVAAPRGAHPGLRAGARGAPGRGVGGLGRLQDGAGRHLHPVRAGALPHLRHRVHLRPPHLPLGAAGARPSRASTPGGAATRRRGSAASCSATRWGRRSASWRGWTRGSAPSSATAPWSG